MPDELSTRQAKRIVKKFCEPPYDLEEARLKEAAWKVLQECKCGSFEWENEEEEEKTSKNKIPKENQSIFESVKKYVVETAQNVQSLGAAGAVAFSSAAYFQTVEAYETTREIGIIIQQVEADYNQSLSSYIMGIVKGEKSTQEAESANKQVTGGAEATTEPEQSEAESTFPEVIETEAIDEIDPIKPHSMVGDDAFEPVITPHDATVVSPERSQK